MVGGILDGTVCLCHALRDSGAGGMTNRIFNVFFNSLSAGCFLLRLKNNSTRPSNVYRVFLLVGLSLRPDHQVFDIVRL